MTFSRAVGGRQVLLGRGLWLGLALSAAACSSGPSAILSDPDVQAAVSAVVALDNGSCAVDWQAKYENSYNSPGNPANIVGQV
jgi:hypothetical protein